MGIVDREQNCTTPVCVEDLRNRLNGTNHADVSDDDYAQLQQAKVPHQPFLECQVPGCHRRFLRTGNERVVIIPFTVEIPCIQGN